MCGAGGPQTEERGARAPRLTRMEGRRAAPDQHPPTATDLGGGAAGLAWERAGLRPIAEGESVDNRTFRDSAES